MQTVGVIVPLMQLSMSISDVAKFAIVGTGIILVIYASHLAFERTLLRMGFSPGWEQPITHHLLRIMTVMHVIAILIALAIALRHELGLV